MNKMKRILSVSLAAAVVAVAGFTVMACAGSMADEAEDSADAGEAKEVDTTYATDKADPDFAEYLGEVKTCQYFSDDPVDEADVEIILNAGINAQSGMNQQDWHFTAVTSTEIMDEMAEDMGTPRSSASSGSLSRAQIADAPLLIIISCGDGTEYDAGLATQAMNSAALALGYGTKIISSPTRVLNGDKQDYYRELLGIPEDMETVGMLLVGTPLDTSEFDPDSITGATGRNPYDEMTTILQ